MHQPQGNSRKWYPFLALFLLLGMGCNMLQGVWPFKKTPSSEGHPPLVSEGGQTGIGEAVQGGSEGGETNGFLFTLSEGSSEPQEITPIKPVEGEPLTDAEVQAILSRMPDLEAGTSGQVEFNLPPDVLPPPRPGVTIEQSFPPEAEEYSPQEVTSGPLEVLRYSPEGEITVAPFISITFNQPMVPLATLQQLTKEDIPVRVTPDLEGTWRWVGTKTLTFNYDSDLIDRLPKATEFTVTIPAGTKSASGQQLEQAVSWKFTTPPPVFTSTYPYSYEPQDIDPLFFITFDQRIDQAAVLETVKVKADGKKVSIRIAKADEIQADEQAASLLKYSPEGRWLAFKAAEPLPKDSEIVVEVGPGTPSAEGPLTTKTVQSYSFRTYGPLKIEQSGCAYGNTNCYPLEPFYIRFNNSLDEDSFREEMITISPVITGSSISIYGNTLNIKGATAGSTTYYVTVAAGITDIFGQQLGRDEKLTFKVGQAEPALIGPAENLVTVDPQAAAPGLSIYTINYNKLDLSIYAVQPSDWPAFKTYVQQYAQTDQASEPPGRKVYKDTLRIESTSDSLTETLIDLSPYMDGKYGHFIVIVKPPSSLFSQQNYYQTVQTWVQITQIGLDALSDHSEMIAWATSLKDGSPLENVKIQANNGSINAVTDKEGLARFSLPSSGIDFLIASSGADKAFLPRTPFVWGEDTWTAWKSRDSLRWYVYDDRAMYKPGEEVHLKGFIRLIEGGQKGDVALPGDLARQVSYSVVDPQGNNLGSGLADVSSLGGFDFSFTIPENANLGYAQVNLTAGGSWGDLDGTQQYHTFQIQEFRRPEFEVTARNETTGPYFVGDEAITAVEAAYYAGGPLTNAEVTWNVSSASTSYQPPNWPDFTFGEWTPWWYGPYYSDVMYEEAGYYGNEYFIENGPPRASYQTFSGRTDATGNHYLRISFDGGGKPRPHSITAEGVVMDINRQAWSSTTSLLVHPASLYVGLRSDSYFVEMGDPLDIDVIVVDLDGKPVADRPVTVVAERLEYKYTKGNWGENPVDAQECRVGSKLEPVSCSFKTGMGGEYRITATITDEMGRENQTIVTRWVSGGKQPPAREVRLETATLIPDKETYQPGDTAKILVQSPFSPAEGMLTVTRSGILYSERFVIEDGTATLEVPIEDAQIPNLNIQVDLVGEAQRLDDDGNLLKSVPGRPAYASGSLTLSIPPLSRTLSLDVTPQDEQMAPGDQTTLDLSLTDPKGKPVADAELAVVVVDEAILSLTGYRLIDPVSTFYYARSSDLSSVYGRSSIVLVNPQELAGNRQVMATQASSQAYDKGGMVMPEAPAAEMAIEEEAVMAAPQSAPEQQQAITIRTDFNPLALFAPDVQTDAQGKASIKVKLPDNLTRYRIMVVAVDDGGKMFGSGEANITARLPLMVRPSATRFLNFGDQFELPVVLQNQTGQDMTVEVVTEATNLEWTGVQGRRVTVPANDRVEVRFPAETVMAGTVNVQVAAVSEGLSDAARISLPVYTPATTEAFAVYGVLDKGAAAQPLARPEDVFAQYGGLEITTSSTALQALTDAVLYLVSYPFECTEQLASRILGVAALRDVLSAFEAEGLPSAADIEKAVDRDIAKLEALQNFDGGFPYWRRGNESIPFNTVHVAHALLRAREMGFNIPVPMWENVRVYLENIENYYPSWYSQQTRWTISAYALYVRQLAGDADAAKAAKLLDEAGLENLSLDAVAWIWQVLSDQGGYAQEIDAIRQHVNNRVVETAGAANFTTSYSDDDYVLLQSDRRTDALLLDAYIQDNPQSDLIPKLVAGLMAHQVRGRWDNTQENVFVLLALNRYFKTYESVEPDFVARVWLGNTYAGSGKFSGYTTDRYQIDIPMNYLIDAMEQDPTQDLIVQKEGDGRLYYRLGLRYAPTDLKMPPVDMGFVIQRVYEAVDDKSDVRLAEDGTWQIKLGARVRVRVTMVADNRRYHVALVDPLPAGLEIINPALNVSESIPADPNSNQSGWWWWWRWYEHQNLRDERAEAFTALLWEGVYEYTYVTRATVPGEFVVPPAKAEEMYSPEVFGRSAGDRVIIE